MQNILGSKKQPYALKILCLALTTSNIQMYILGRWNFIIISLGLCFICNHRVFLIYAQSSRNADSCELKDYAFFHLELD